MSKIKAGTRVVRKRDNASGVIVSVSTVIPCQAHPGPFGKTFVSIRLDDETLRQQVGGDMSGDLHWLKSDFRPPV